MWKHWTRAHNVFLCFSNLPIRRSAKPKGYVPNNEEQKKSASLQLKNRDEAMMCIINADFYMEQTISLHTNHRRMEASPREDSSELFRGMYLKTNLHTVKNSRSFVAISRHV